MHNKVKLLLALGILLRLSVFPAAAGVYEDAGVMGFQFLKIPFGARPVGMGGAFTAVADDINSAWWNPAGLAVLEKQQVSLSHNQWFSDISRQAVSFAYPVSHGVFCAGIQYLHMGDIEGYDIDGTGDPLRINNFTCRDTCGVLSYARTVRTGVSAGASIKVIEEQLEREQSAGFAVDMGAVYRTGGGISAGLSVRNAGTMSRVASVTESLPYTVNAGISGRLMDGKLLLSIDADKPADRGYGYSVGTEFKMDRILLRAGYNPQNDFDSGFSFGLGAGFGQWSVDYAYVPYGELGGTHRISLISELGFTAEERDVEGEKRRIEKERRKIEEEKRLLEEEKRKLGELKGEVEKMKSALKVMPAAEPAPEEAKPAEGLPVSEEQSRTEPPAEKQTAEEQEAAGEQPGEETVTAELPATEAGRESVQEESAPDGGEEEEQETVVSREPEAEEPVRKGEMQLLRNFNLLGNEKEKVIAFVSFTEGNPELKGHRKFVWVSLSTGTFLYKNDMIRTDALSRAEILFMNGTMVKIREDSILVLSVSPGDGGIIRKIQLRLGEVFSVITGDNSRFDVNTEMCCASVRGTEFGVRYIPDVRTEVVTMRGLVNVSNRLGGVDLPEDMMTLVLPGKAPRKPFKLTAEMIPKWKEEIRLDMDMKRAVDELLREHREESTFRLFEKLEKEKGVIIKKEKADPADREKQKRIEEKEKEIEKKKEEIEKKKKETLENRKKKEEELKETKIEHEKEHIRGELAKEERRIESIRQEEEKIAEEESRLEEEQKQLRNAVPAGRITIVTTEKAVKFVSGSVEIPRDSYPVLDKIAEVLKAVPGYMINIEGHTDNTGDPDDNLRLSLERAENIEKFFVERNGIPFSRFKVSGAGSYEPIAPNDTSEGRAKNRRVEIRLER